MQPKMVVVAGPAGSGKSTTFPVYSFGLDSFNADDCAAELNTGSYQGITAAIRIQVGKELEDFVLERITAGTSFAIETTLRTDVTFRQAQMSREAGFRIEMLYINAGDFQNCLTRVIARGLTGGHSAPAERLKRIYEASLQNLPRAIREMDGVRAYDSSRSGLSPELVLEAICGKLEFSSNPMPDWLENALSRG